MSNTVTTPALPPQSVLRSLVATLAEPARRPVIRDDGSLDVAEVPALLTQLHDAVPPSGETGGGGRSGGSPAGADVGAIDLLEDISSAVLDLHLHVVRYQDLSDAERLAEIGRLAQDWPDGPELVHLNKVLGMAVRKITELLDPAAPLSLPGACPHCRDRMAWRWDSAYAEWRTRRALAVTTDPNKPGQIACVTCLGCKSRWSTPDELNDLAYALDADQRAQQVERRHLRTIRRGMAAHGTAAARLPIPIDSSTWCLIDPSRVLATDDAWHHAVRHHLGEYIAARILAELVHRYKQRAADAEPQ